MERSNRGLGQAGFWKLSLVVRKAVISDEWGVARKAVIQWRVAGDEWREKKFEERSRSLPPRRARDDSERAEEGGPQDPGSNYEPGAPAQKVEREDRESLREVRAKRLAGEALVFSVQHVSWNGCATRPRRRRSVLRFPRPARPTSAGRPYERRR